MIISVAILNRLCYTDFYTIMVYDLANNEKFNDYNIRISKFYIKTY
jgi:hypothetical protein